MRLHAEVYEVPGTVGPATGSSASRLSTTQDRSGKEDALGRTRDLASRSRAGLAGMLRGSSPSPPGVPPPSAPRSPGPSRSRGPLHACRGLLPRGRGRTVVVVTDSVDPAEVAPWLRPFADDDVVVLAPDPGALASLPATVRPSPGVEDALEQVTRLPTVHVVLDLRRAPGGPRSQMWESLFLSLVHGGAYVVGRLDTGLDLWVEEREWLAVLNQDPAEDFSTSAECVRCTTGVMQRPDLLLLQKSRTHRVKLLQDTALEVLAHRDPDVTVRELISLPATTLPSRAAAVEHGAGAAAVHGGDPESGMSRMPALIEDVRPALSEEYDVPELHLRHVTGEIVFAGQTLMYTQHSVLPDSFRYPFGRVLDNPYLHAGPSRFARVHYAASPKDRRLEGDFYQLDPQWSGHFGHLMTEVVGRLWGWDEAKRQLPDLKALFRARPGTDEPELERALLRGYGIADEDIVWIEEATTVSSLVSATVMWHNYPPRYVHPQLPEVWDRLRDGLVSPSGPHHDRIFVSRQDTLARRRCRNREAVEELFARHGFEIVYPERHDLATQASIFAHASVVAGFGGSAMFNLMFAEHLEHTIVLSHDSYWARNEHMYTSLLGGTAHYFWSAPDVPPPASGWSPASANSAWTFDLPRHGQTLEDLLASL